MSKLLTIIAGISGSAIIGGAGIYLISTQKTKTFEQIFKNSLITTDEIFKEKLNKLKTNSLNSDNAKLKEAKRKVTANSLEGLAELKAGCKEIYNSNFTNKESNIFKDFRSYCSKNIKDQVNKDKWAVGASGFDWKTKHPKLNQQKQNLVPKLAEIANKSSIGENDLKNWCESIENSLFEGPEDKTFKNANDFCTK